jgi:hypothetical protein
MSSGGAASIARLVRSRGLRWLAWGALLLAALLGRTLWSAREEWQAAQAALASGDDVAAVMHLRRTAIWHTPLSPYTERALAALSRLGAKDGAKTGRMAEQAKVAADHATRSVTAVAGDPSPFFALLALLGWLAWSGSALYLVASGLDAQSFPGPLAPRALAVLVAGFMLFVLGLALA